MAKNNKKNIKTVKNITLILGVLTSCAFPLGVVGTVLGAVNGVIAVMVLGLVFTVISFFALPFVWIAFGSLVGKSKIYDCIVNRGVKDTLVLAQIFNKTEQEIILIINGLIAKGYLSHEVLYKPEQEKVEITNLKCPNCGAVIMQDENGKRYCPYCNSVIE